MDLATLKTQVMTMFMMKTGQQQHGGGGGEIFQMIYAMILMSVVDWLFKQIPALTAFAQEKLGEIFKKNTKRFEPILKSAAPEPINSVTLVRSYKKDDKSSGGSCDNPTVEKIDAVLDLMCNLDDTQHIRMDVRSSLNTTDDITLTPLLKAKVSQISNGEDSSTQIVLFSKVLRLSGIRDWIDQVHTNYVFEKNNKLGNKLFFFDEVVVDPPIMTDMTGRSPTKSLRWDLIPRMLTFYMNEFTTNKSFDNVYGSHVTELKARIDLFVNHPEWYIARGIPHTLGIMMYGIPGAGKTSTIKAISKMTRRHPFNIRLRECTSQKQLTNLFFNETVVVQTYDGTKQTLKIPLNRRFYIIEDIDCLTDVVIDRDIKRQEAREAREARGASGDETRNEDEVAEGDSLTLSFILNLLDGVLETPGRLLAISSNKPERLDKAFVRPGRIDVRIEFKHANREFILDTFNKFYSLNWTLDDIPVTIENIFTPAEVMESLCNNFNHPESALEQLVSRGKALEDKKHQMNASLLDELGLTTTEAVVPEVVPEVATAEVAASAEVATEVTTELIGATVTEVAADMWARTDLRKSKDATAGNFKSLLEERRRFEENLTTIKPTVDQTKYQMSLDIRPDILPSKQSSTGPSLWVHEPMNLMSTTTFVDAQPPEGAGGWWPGQAREGMVDTHTGFDLNPPRA